MNWYVIHTANQAVTKHIFDTHENIREAFYPMRHETGKEEGIRRAKSLFPSYVFVRGGFKEVSDIVRSHSSFEMEYTRGDGMRCPMIIPDEEMEHFKAFNEHHLDMMWLRDPYQAFLKNDRARILSGPFAGYEGFIKEIKHDMKLIFRVGIWAIAISNVHKYDISVVSHTADIPEEGRIARLIDYFTEAIRKAGNADYPCKMLRELVRGIGESGSVEKYEQKLEKEKASDSSVERILLRSFLRGTDADDKGMLEQMTRYIYSKTPNPVLTRIIPDSPVRPFLTRTQDGNGIPVEMKEGVYDAETDKSVETTHRYYAHVRIFDKADGSRILITNWTSFYRQFLDLTSESKAQFLSKLEKFHINLFLRCLTKEEGIRFMELPEHGIAGLGTILSKEEDTEAARSRLVTVGANLCAEIAASTRLRPWQRHLSTVWLR